MSAKKFTIPLAWLQLSWDRFRFAAALSGIVFAVALMLIQLGFSDALLSASIQVHTKLKADLVMLSSQYEYVISTRNFSRRYLYQTLASPDVASVAPLYVCLANWKTLGTQRELPIFLFGCDPDFQALDIPEVNANLDKLKLVDVVFFDEGSKPEYGRLRGTLEKGEQIFTEVSGRRVQVGGVFALGISFAADGNLITSENSFLRLVPTRNIGSIDIGLIRLKPGSDPEIVRQKLLPTLAPGIQLLTREQYAKYERNYWAARTPIGFIFSLGTFVGFIVGAVIVYQILYTDVTDHIGEYATLKAMGYTDLYLFSVVMKQGLILAVIGFVPGWFISTGMTILTRKVTLLPSYMTWERSVGVLTLTIVMCVLSGMLAMHKLRSADPADIF